MAKNLNININTSTIGIIGGGQLCKMMIESLKNENNYKFIVLDTTKTACAFNTNTEKIIGDFNDKKNLKKLFNESDFITYEFENIPSKILYEIENVTKKKTTPSVSILEISQNRIKEKTTLQSLGFSVAEFKKINNINELKTEFKKFKSTCILKSCSGGYDGKNQWQIQNLEDINKIKLEKNIEYILEKKIDFVKEISCIAFRSEDDKNKIINLPISENIHKNGILHISFLPANINDKTNEKIITTVKKIIKKLNIFGTLAVEFFITKDNKVLINEIAPRPHNSGHFSLNACNYSQFDLHIKAVTKQKLPEIVLKTPVVMLNILGQNIKNIENYKFKKNEYLYLYGKKEIKTNRKMGHINFCGKSIDKLVKKAQNFYTKTL